MKTHQYATLKRLLKTQKWEKALTKVEELLVANPCAAQLHLLRGQLIQLQGEETAYTLDEAEASFKRALAFDDTYFDALVELMHWYDVVYSDTAKAVEYAKKVKAIAQKSLDAASEVLADQTISAS